MGPRSAVRPNEIVSHLRKIASHFQLGRQECAHEFTRFFSDALVRSCTAGKGKVDMYEEATTIPHRVFGGWLRSRVTCANCHNNSDSFDSFLDLNLEIKVSLAHLSKLSVNLCHFLTFLSFFVILCHIDCVSCHFCNLLIAGLWFAAGLSSPLHGARDARPGCGAVQVWKVPPPDARLETSDHSQTAKRARHLAQTLQHYGQQNRARNQVSFAVELGAIRLHQERRTQVWPLRHFGALWVHGQFRTLLQLLQNAAGQLVQVYIQ